MYLHSLKNHLSGTICALTGTVPYGTHSPMENANLKNLDAAEPADHASEADARPSQREQEVLSTVLDLMVEQGDAFSMAEVARRASCSKETLYRWYGDRDGLLTATVKWQASKVAMPVLDEAQPTIATFKKALTDFARSWLTVLTGEISIALNRLAISHAGNRKSGLGDIVLRNGPLGMKERLGNLFEVGRCNGFISLADDEAFRLFFGLVVADTQVRALLGENAKPTETSINEWAAQASDRFLAAGNSN